MTEQESKNLIRETFESDFNRERFKRFTANLLTEFQEASILTSEQYIKDAYKPYVHSYEVIAKFTDSEKRTLDVLITYLETESTFTARTRQRNFALDYLKSKNRDGVLIAYVHENKKDWRFSFVKLENDVVKGEDGRVKDISSFTAAKRSSFLVGSNENSYTAKKQFLPIIQSEEQPKFEDIEEAFSVETVTKEFFNKYRELFHVVHDALEKEIKRKPQLKEEFEEKEVSTVDFAKKLLGQMVFLYFLQKKGWFGVRAKEDWGTGPKDFLRKLFEAKDRYGENFFNDVLEPLFYEALAQDRGRDAIYPRLNNCRMPFLNGGLFEPMRGYSWETTDIFLPDDLFSNKNKDGEDTGDGILDVFDRYNFTVNESDPLEKEVAVDPEMLGKVFENLLDVKDRKSKGSFYTPREIVHYMCQQCLINYLKTETKGEIPRENIEDLVLNGETIIQNDFVTLEKQREKEEKGFKYSGTYELKLPESIQKNARKIDDLLKDIKVCDPAVGSGAFPLGMINEIVGARQVLQVYLKDRFSVYDLKYHAIANSIHGVDIDPGAVDIARLRLWLSLVVEEIDPRPLPNLEHRIMQGNSLVSEYEGIQLFNRELLTKSSDEKFVQLGFVFGSGIKRKMEELERNIKIYVDTSQKSVKEKLKESIDELRWELIEETLKEQGKQDKVEEIKHLREKNERPFFVWELEFSEVFKEKGGFDVMIANPPYVEFKNLAQKDKKILEKIFQTTTGKYDLYIPFYENALNILKERGVLAFINPTRFMHRDYGKKLREFILKNTTIQTIIDFSDFQIFDTALAYTGIFIIEKSESRGNEIMYKKSKSIVGGNHLSEILKTNNSTSEVDVIFLQQGSLGSSSWYVSNSEELKVLEKIQNGSSTLEEITEGIYQGIATGKDEVFIIDGKKQEELGIEDKVVKPILKGKDIFPYGVKWKDTYVIYPYDDDGTPYSEEYFKANCPNCYAYLSEMTKELSGRGYFDNSNKLWFELWNQRNLNKFKGKKIITLDNASKNSFALDTKSFVGSTTSYSIRLKDNSIQYEYLLALLNSKLLNFYHKRKSVPQAGGFFRYQATFIKSLPVKAILSENQSEIISLVNEILKLTSEQDYDPHNPPQEQRELEEQIDPIVYKLYGLTKEEIELVEKSTKA